MSKSYRSVSKGLRVRTEACRLAAQVLASRPEVTPIPLVWSLACFFEKYMAEGAVGTFREFGPKPPVKLRAVRAKRPR